MKDSYAAAASKIMQKYKIRLGKDLDKDDTLARQGLELEMNRLKEKQEATKVTMVGNKKKYGGNVLPKYKWPDNENGYNMQLDNNGNEYRYPEPYLTPDQDYQDPRKAPNMSLRPYSGPNVDTDVLLQDRMQDIAAVPMARTNVNIPLKSKSPYVSGYNGGLSSTITNDPQKMQEFSDASIKQMQLHTNSTYPQNQNQDDLYEPTLSVVPLAASILGNALLLGDNEAENIKYDRVKPELISLAREREAARRRADFSRNASKRTARGLGLSGGAAATVANAADVDIDRGLGEQIGKSYLNEELSNKEAINRSKMMNAEISMREKDANLREKDSVKDTKTAAIQGIIGNVGDYFADTNKARQYNDLTQMMSDDYAYYEQPGQTTFDKIFSGTRKTKKYTGTYNG